MRLRGRTIVVTGAASGIGAATAARCLEEGACVHGVDIQPCSPDIPHSVMDVTSETAVAGLFAGLGPIDGLVNSAGIARRSPAADQDEAGWEAVFDVNVKGAWLCSKHALTRMLAGGSIVHLSSVVGLVGVRNRAAYSASKGALAALTLNMAMDYAGAGIRVNCVCPGFTRTPLTAGLLSDPEREEKLTALHPLGRLGEPEDVAAAIVFLLSDEASWITGQALAVDGGFSAGHGQDV